MTTRCVRFLLLVLSLCLCVIAPATAQEETGFSFPKTFRDWWQSPAQQAQSAWKKSDNERLRQVAPSAQWQGAAAYRAGDFETAKDAYSSTAINPDEATMSVFNQATTEIQLGNFAQAIEQLDTLLANQPEHADAARNRAIAQRLLELEQQQGDEQEQGEGEPSSDADSSESDESQSGEDSGDGESGESENTNDSEQQEGSDQDESNESGDDSSSPSEGSEGSTDSEQGEAGDDASGDEQSDDEIDAARQALQAAGDEPQDESGDTDAEPLTVGLNDEPFSEQDQATEQWLRQIPDDPDDLLRRKLLQNHRSEYPDVQVNGRGW